MNGFRLIAIQVLDNCFYEARKLLPIGELYQIFGNYKFTQNSTKEVTSIEQIQPDLVNLHNINNANGTLEINVSAIVGKNGSGKSTILELFYAFCLCLAKDQHGISEELNKINARQPFRSRYIQILFDNLHVEVFYETNGQLNSIIYKGRESVKHFHFSPQRNVLDKFDVSEFCYTIAINYSIYGLNETNTPWLTPMFHKNDGYQAPLVINPYRDDGNIDVNNEYDLANSRLIQTISTYVESNPEILSGQYLDRIHFSFEPRSLDTITYEGQTYRIDDIIEHYEKTKVTSVFDFLNMITVGLAGFTLAPQQISKFKEFIKYGTEINIANYKAHNEDDDLVKNLLEYWFARYVIKKVFKICLQYSWFREEYITKSLTKSPMLNLKNEEALVQNLITDKSHITLKLRQTIYTWANRYFFDSIKWGYSTNGYHVDYFACFCELKSNQLAEALRSHNFEDPDQVPVLEIIPGGLLKPEIILQRESGESTGQAIPKLSSGEQQFLFTINTILYHLRNLESVFEGDRVRGNELLKYSSVLIILDEVELYFHPEFQRTFIFELIRHISRTRLINVQSINILFSTHSPFLLSDIPASNILKLKNGLGQKIESDDPTFGANIHDLLANEFYMEKGYMGEWAKFILRDLITFLTRKETIVENVNSTWDETNSKATIALIGEPLLKERLERLYESKYVNPYQDKIRKRIAELQLMLQNEKNKT